MKTQTIAIIGMNLIGVSIGLALKNSAFKANIVGHDADRDKLQFAKELKAIDKSEWNLISTIIKADIIILSLSMDELELTLEAIGNDLQEHTVILDLSSQKELGAKWAAAHLKQGHYISAVPVFGVEALMDGRSLEKVAHPELFRNSLFCMMPAKDAEPEAVETAVNVGLLVGALPYFIDAEEYDALQKGISVVPGLLSAAIFGAVQDSPGWRDMLRFADQPFAMVTKPLEKAAETSLLSVKDKSATLRWLDAVLQELHNIRRLVYEGDADIIQALLAERNQEREKWLRKRDNNNWAEEAKVNTTAVPGLAEQIMGDYLSQRLRQAEEEK